MEIKKVKHIRICRADDLWKLRGSKYVQSNIGDTYSQVLNDLKEGRKVLFSGTPCQIDGLRLYLGNSYKNLVTIEIICHGTPSPRIFSNYLKYMENRLGSEIIRISFRDEIGGGVLIMKIETKNGTIYQEDKFTDPYYKMFLSNVCLRESCYQCPSRGLHERADITLSDFWGVESVAPDLIDGGGISLVLVHTIKGNEIFNEIKKSCIGHEVDYADALNGNGAFFNSYEKPVLRDRIGKDIDVLNFEKLVDRYTVTRKEKIKRILKRLHLLDAAKLLLNKE